MHFRLLTILTLNISCKCLAFTGFLLPSSTSRIQTRTDAKRANDDESDVSHNNRRKFIVSSATLATSIITSFPNISRASGGDDDITEIRQPKRTIQGCPKPIPGKSSNCVSTSNIKQLETYSPPWTFQCSSDEAFARIKGLLKSSEYTITEVDDDSRYIKADVNRFNGVDSIEFLVKEEDNVVVFKSYEKEGPANGISDFGANRNRVDELRKKSNGVFALMGEGLGTADSFEGGAFGSRNGIAGQLKAFYGLQSGAGFEDAFN